MARFRTYKNGITGHRYKGYYVIRRVIEDKKSFAVVNENQEQLSEEYPSYWDCEWFIDKMTASSELQELLLSLYQEDIYTLSQFMMNLMHKDETEGINIDEKVFLEWVKKIRTRKADNKPF